MKDNETAVLSVVHCALEKAQKRGVDQAEVRAVVERGFSVTARQGDVEIVEHHAARSLDIMVYQQQRVGSASVTDFSKQPIDDVVDQACTRVAFTSADPYAGLADPALLAYDYRDVQLFHPWNITPQQAIVMTVACEKTALQQDPRIQSSQGVSLSTIDVFYVYANTHGFTGSYWKSEHSMQCALLAREKKQIQQDEEYTCARSPSQLTSPDVLAQRAADKTVHRLHARRLKTRHCPVVFHAPVARSLLRCFVSAITGANIYRDASFLQGRLGEDIFPTRITIGQNPHEPGAMGSAPFDSEGVRTQKIHYVEQGRLINYSLGSYSGRKLGMPSTGNAGGVYNLWISHSDQNLNELLKTMDTGFLVTELMGQGVSIVTGNYSRGAVGFWVEKGQIQYPVHEVTIAGKLPDMFRQIVQVGNDVDIRGNIQTGSILLANMTVAGEAIQEELRYA